MYRPEEPEITLEQVLAKLRAIAGRLGFSGGRSTGAYFVLGVLLFALLVWLGTGFYTVQPGEQAALRILGRFDSIHGPGLHWAWPAPIGTRNVVQVDEIRRLELGVRGTAPVPDEALMITGDENIVDVQLLVQFKIKDLESYLFRAVDPAGATIKDVAETALRQVVGSRNIDDVLTTEKEAVQAETRALVQQLLDTYETGIEVTQVNLQNVRPPAQVQDAFDDVVRAREDKTRIINLAEAYREDVLPKARGEAAKLMEAAEAFKAERVAIATGEAQRFLSILEEYRKAPDITRQRMYLEAMEEVLPNSTKFIVDTDSSGNLLQFLPLGGMPAPGPTPSPSPQPQR